MSSTVLSDVESESDAEQALLNPNRCPQKPKSLSELSQPRANPELSIPQPSNRQTFDVLVSLDDSTASNLDISTKEQLLPTRKFTIGPSSPSKYLAGFGLLPRNSAGSNLRVSSNKRRGPISQMSLDETSIPSRDANSMTLLGNSVIESFGFGQPRSAGHYELEMADALRSAA